MMPGAGGDVNTTLPLLLNVMALVMCGATLITAPLSITGIVFAIRAKNAIAAGDVTTARSKAKQSRMAFVGTLLIGLVLIVIWQLLTPSSPPR